MSKVTALFAHPLTLLKRTFALLLSGIIFVSAQLGTCIGETEGTPIQATRHQYKFDNSGILIGAYNYDMNHADDTHVGYVKEADIDFLITTVNEKFLNLCDKHDVGVIMTQYSTLPYSYASISADAEAKWLSMTDTTLTDLHECVWGHNLIDEPHSTEFSKINGMAQSYYSHTDGLLPYVNLFPIYANSEQLTNEPEYTGTLAELLNEVDFINSDISQYKRHVSDYINNIDTDYICVDIYPLGVDDDGNKTTSVLWLRNLDILAEACRETGRDLWVITQAAGNVGSGSGDRRYNDADDIRWQAFVSLSFGAKAIIHACYDTGWWDRDSHLINKDGERTQTYYAAQTVDAELKAISDVYGQYSNQGAYLVNKGKAAGTMSYKFMATLMPVEPELKPIIASSDPLLVGCFTAEDGGKAYTFVNISEPVLNESAKAAVTFDGASEITVYSKGVPTVVKGNTIELSIASADGVFVTVK